MNALVSFEPDSLQALPKERSCGAIALVRAYKRLGLQQDLETVWRRIRTRDRNGDWASASYRLAGDAMDRGFQSLAIKLKDADALLDNLNSIQELQVIACHRLRDGSKLGHFSFVESVNRQKVTVWFDDRVGTKFYSRSEFLDLWQNWSAGDEFRPKIVIAIWPPNSQHDVTQQAGNLKPTIPNYFKCLRCGESISLKLLQRLFAREFAETGERGWEAVFCPRCDAAHR